MKIKVVVQATFCGVSYDQVLTSRSVKFLFHSNYNQHLTMGHSKATIA